MHEGHKDEAGSSRYFAPFPAQTTSDMLRIAYDAEKVPNGGSSVERAVITAAGKKEPVGFAFHSKVRAAVGAQAADVGAEEPAQQTDATSACETNNSLSGFVDPRRDSRRLNASKGKKGRLQKDYYGYLGLGNSRWQATSKDIERAYKNIALRFHPDKCAGTGASEREREAVEERFKLIGEAYEVLTDTRKRREFDSVDGGEDNLPTSCEESKFYETFAPAVERMARWSARKPVPMLGDENTPYNEVEKFYRFWHQFKSWREFPQDDEYDLEDAEGREHKRWMQKENEKMRKKAKQEESQRIRTFVQTMESLDPRVLEKKEADRKRREEKKEARKSTASKGDEQAPQHKQQQKQQSREKGAAASSTTARATPAPSAAASDASSRTEDEQQSDEAQDKKDKEKEKKQMRKERQKIRKEAQRASDHLGDQKAVEALCSHCSMKYLKRLNDVLGKLEAGSLIARVINKEAKQLNGEELSSDEAELDLEHLASETSGTAENGEAGNKQHLPDLSDDEVNTLLEQLKSYERDSVSEDELWEGIATKLSGRKGSELYRYFHLKLRPNMPG